MMDLLANLTDTPVPNVLVIAGVIFLVLAIAGQVGANLSIPPQRQAVAATIGIALLASGIGLFLIPSDEPEVTEQVGVTSVEPPPRFRPTQEADRTPSIDYAEMRAAVVATIRIAASRAIAAARYLDATKLNTVYTGTILNIELARIDSMRRNGEFKLCEVMDREFLNIELAEGAGRATVDMTESWDCAMYSAESRECLRQQASVRDHRQTVYLVRQGSSWLITNVDHGETFTPNPGVPCTDRWPANLPD